MPSRFWGMSRGDASDEFTDALKPARDPLGESDYRGDRGSSPDRSRPTPQRFTYPNPGAHGELGA
jgi:hypothetical protein